MNTPKPFAALVTSNGDAHPSSYIRFNSVCNKYFKGVQYAYINKTSNGDFLVIRPATEKNRHTSTVVTDRSGGIKLACDRIIRSGFISDRFFGKRYKVKKDGAGQLYVCLREPLEEQFRGEAVE